MVDAAPFRALRYDPGVAGAPVSTSAPAYDDLERFTYAKHRTASPYTVLELLASEGSAPDDPYRSAGAAFARWLRTGVLVTDDTPAFYRYDIHELRHGVPTVVRGLLAAVAVGRGDLLAHESVDESRVKTRLERMAAVPADLAPLYAVHRAAPATLRAVLDAPPVRPPLVALTDEAGADHRVWSITDPEAMNTIRRDLAALPALIADGHHRHAAAVALQRVDNQPLRTLTYLVDGSTHAPELRAIHRVVKPLDNAVERLADAFDVRPAPAEAISEQLDSAPKSVPAFGLVRGDGTACVLVARDAPAVRALLPAGRGPAWCSLDAAVWESVIRPRLGASVEYRSDIGTARARADMGADAGMFILRPPAIDAVYACAAAGDEMPTKTTWFRPKPRAGLVMRSLH